MWWRIVLAGVAAGSCAIVLTAGARGGSGHVLSAATIETPKPPHRAVAHRPALDSADVAFARSLAADDRQDAAADALASRKAATAGLMSLAVGRRAEDERELASITKSGTSPGIARGASIPGALVANDGWRFDVVYLSLALQRDRLEQTLARRELRWGRSVALRALARRILRVRAAETAAFQRS